MGAAVREHGRLRHAPFPLGCNERERLEDLAALQILDTPRDQDLDGLCSLACTRFQVPIAAISLVGDDRQWFKASQGLAIQQTAREIAFCAHAILSDEVMVVPDAACDPRFVTNPLVRGEPRIRFYAGAPLAVSPSLRVGSFCLMDTQPRQMSRKDRIALGGFAALVACKLLRFVTAAQS